jgi:hypothetical protein
MNEHGALAASGAVALLLIGLAAAVFLADRLRAADAPAAPPAAAGQAGRATPPAAETQIRLIIRGDDIGSSHAANEACIKSFREGIERSTEIMVPAPWYREAVRMLKEAPGLDVGVHLTLTSEWDGCKWGPITRSPSLMDKYGHFHPNTGEFLQAGPKPEEVEKELRAQIELAKADLGGQVSHLSSHMGTATARPELRAIAEKLAKEYGLPLEAPGVKNAGREGGALWSGAKTAEEKEAGLVQMLEGLTPGTWLLVEHPGLDTPEMRGLGHKGYDTVATGRAAVTYAFTSEKAKAAVARRGVRLISYADYLRSSASP